MIRVILDKLREVSGPMKQTRLVVADLAEEMLDLAEHYIKQRLGSRDLFGFGKPCCSETGQEETKAEPEQKRSVAQVEPEKKKPVRDLEVAPELETALDNAANQKKQEFKVLAILWDAQKREMGPMSAKAISRHGEDLGLAIRHENVRKVIRTKLSKYVETRTERTGNTTIYRYMIGADGSEYFASKYLD